jgi:precorrin-6Y C5,15-methyltransferase (decarboxylating)
VFEELPDPDAVFVAGAGREVTRISQAAYKRLRPRGRLVVNTTSVDHLMELRETLKSSSADARVWMINLARGTDQLDRLSFEPLKPSFLLAVTKTA